MTEEQKKRLMDAAIDLLTKSITMIDQGVDFAKEQIPLFVTEFVKYTMYESLILGSVCLLFVTLGVAGAWNLWTKPDEQSNWDTPKPYFKVIFKVIAALVGFGCFFGMVHYYNKAVKAAVAPRVLLFDTVKSWAGSNGCQNK